MIARLAVKTPAGNMEYPIATKTRGGWQNGVTFYPDTDVTKVTPLVARPASLGDRLGDPEPAELPEDELPGMWERSDFLGGETDKPLNIERENAAASHVKADRDEWYSNPEDRVHNAFVSGAEWERDGHGVGGIAGLPPTATPTSADTKVSYDEATAALEKFREVGTTASDIDAMWAVLIDDRVRMLKSGCGVK